jgi:hypothetical protein
MIQGISDGEDLPSHQFLDEIFVCPQRTTFFRSASTDVGTLLVTISVALVCIEPAFHKLRGRNDQDTSRHLNISSPLLQLSRGSECWEPFTIP